MRLQSILIAKFRISARHIEHFEHFIDAINATVTIVDFNSF